VDAVTVAGADFIVKGLRNPVDFDIEQQMAHMNHAAAGVRTVFLPCRPEVGFVSSRFIREIAAHGGLVDHVVPKPVAVALADRFGASPP
jgi:pantetheine-phosphate adenylyltransferase